MKKLRTLIATLVALIVFLAPPLAVAAEEESGIVAASSDILSLLVGSYPKPIPGSIYSDAKAIVVAPGCISSGFLITGECGRGILLVRKDSGSMSEWSNPIFIRLSGGMRGIDLGAPNVDLILIFNSPDATEQIKSGMVSLGYGVSVAKGPLMQEYAVQGDFGFSPDVYAYVNVAGVLSSADIITATLGVDSDANARFYGKSGITVDAIVRSEQTQMDGEVSRLSCLASSYVRRFSRWRYSSCG